MSRPESHRIRSGDEPVHARSPLRLRLALALFGVFIAVAAVVFFIVEKDTGLAVACSVAGLAALADAAVVVRHLRQGPHYQPGRDIPPYRPADQPHEPVEPRPPLSRLTREHIYLAMMGTCLALIVIAWTLVRFYSTTAAVVMSAVAAFIPPIAAIVANARGER